MTKFLLLAVAVTAVVVWDRWGGTIAGVFAFVMTACVAPVVILTVTTGNELTRTSIAGPEIQILSYYLALLFALLVAPGIWRRRNFSMLLLLVPIALAVIASVQGDLTTHVASGIVNWFFAALAWVLGAHLAAARQNGVVDDRVLAWLIATPLLCNAVAVGLQVAGVLAVTTQVGYIERVSGLAGHSGNLGKILILFTILALPLSLSQDRFARRAATLSVATSFVMIGLSYSRANTFAFVGMLGLWYLLRPGGMVLKRLVGPAVIGAASIPFVEVLLVRNAADPSGGSRPQLVAAAHEQISRTFWWGVGPNDYKSTVGGFSQISGFLPVHNSFLLVVAENGAIITALVLLPLAVAFWLAIRRVRANGAAGAQAVAVLAATPGFVVIAVTGHGLVGYQFSLMLYFILGFVCRIMRTPEDPAEGGAAGKAARPEGRYAARTT